MVMLTFSDEVSQVVLARLHQIELIVEEPFVAVERVRRVHLMWLLSHGLQQATPLEISVASVSVRMTRAGFAAVALPVSGAVMLP